MFPMKNKKKTILHPLIDLKSLIKLFYKKILRKIEGSLLLIKLYKGDN